MKHRVLIVEDEAIVADDFRHQVLEFGYEVAGVTDSGPAAIALALETKPDVVLIDVQLQESMTGTEAARVIQENTGAAIVYITAFAAIFVRDPAQMVSPGICLSKPFSPGQLKIALAAAVSEPSQGHLR